MKKVLITSLFFLIMCGCSKIEEDTKKYHDSLNELVNINKSDENLPFNIEIELKKLADGEYAYIVTIDSPKKELNNIQIVMMHNYKTDNIFPSSGIFDEKLNLIPGVVDENKNIVKGIVLVGYIESKEINNIEFKVILKSDEKVYHYEKLIESL